MRVIQLEFQKIGKSKVKNEWRPYQLFGMSWCLLLTQYELCVIDGECKTYAFPVSKSVSNKNDFVFRVVSCYHIAHMKDLGGPNGVEVVEI